MVSFLRRILGPFRRRTGPPLDGMPPGRYGPRAQARDEISRAVAASNAAELARTGADTPDVPFAARKGDG